MEIGNEISQKIRSAIKAKLIEQGAYVDDELPDYIMVMVANKKSQKQMTDDLSLFLGTNTEKFTSWLHSLLKKLQSINTDEPTANPPKPKTKEKVKGEKRKHRSSQGEKEKKADTDKQRKPSTGEKEKTEKKKAEDKVEPGAAKVKPVQKAEETTVDELNIIENTDEFNEENVAAEVKELTQSSSTGKPPPPKVSKVDKSTDAKKSATKSSVSSSKTRSSSSSSAKSRHDGGSSSRKKPSSIVASVKRRYEELEEDEEEYDPNNPAVGSVASVVRGPTRKSSIPKSLQANKSLLMKAVTEAEKSVTTKKISPESKPAMRSDRQPVNLKHRLKTAAGLGLISRSKRAEMSQKYTGTSPSSQDTVKKPRKSDESFENMSYTIKNVTTQPPKKVSPKAPATAPVRVAATALGDIASGSKVKQEVTEADSDADEEGSEISTDENDELSGEDLDDCDSEGELEEEFDSVEESEEEIEIEITDRAAQTLLNMRDPNINLSEWKCTIDCKESGSQTDLTESNASQSTSSTYKLSKEKLEQIDASLLDMFIENLMPFDFVENEPFKMFAKSLESKYHFPKRKKLVTEVGILYNTVRDLIKTDISKEQSGAFTHSSWTTTDHQCYDTIKVHFITNDWILRSLMLKTSKISEIECYDEVAQSLQDTKTKWMLTNPILVTSGSKSERKIVEVLDWQHVVCFGSCIQAVIRKSLNSRAVSSFLEQGRKLVSDVLDNAAVIDVFRSKKLVLLHVDLHNTDLVLDVAGTWSSSLEMLTVLSDLTPALHAAVMDTELINSGVDLRSQLFNFNQQSSLESLTKILSTFKTATEILTGTEQPTLQKVVPIFVKLDKVLEEKSEDCTMISDLKVYVKEEIKTLMNTCKETCLLACLLHPQTKQMAFVSTVEKDEIKSVLFNEVKSLCESEFKQVDDKNKKFRKGKKGVQRQTKAMSEASTESDVRRVIVNTECEDNGAQVDTETTDRDVDNLSGQTSEEDTSYQEEEDGGGVRASQSDKSDSQSNITAEDSSTSLDRSVSGTKLNLSITVENDWLDDVICATEDPRSPEETAKIELNLYMAEPASGQNPLSWWKEKQLLYPHIACIARRILAIPASSVKSEDIFHLEKVPDSKLIQVKPEHVDMMLFLKENKSVYESD